MVNLWFVKIRQKGHEGHNKITIHFTGEKKTVLHLKLSKAKAKAKAEAEASCFLRFLKVGV